MNEPAIAFGQNLIKNKGIYIQLYITDNWKVIHDFKIFII